MLTPELIAGPYLPPECTVGGWIDDEIDGRLEVGGWTAAPISWPRRKKTGRASLILCGDLVRAVRTESSEAVAHWWGVGITKVWMWRKALGVGRVTDGTRKLLQERTGVPPEAAARGRAAAAEPEARARMADSKRGKPAAPATREALLRAAKRRKPAGFGVRANAAMLGRALPELKIRAVWTAEEDAALQQMWRRRSVTDIALLIGRTEPAVTTRAKTLGLARPKEQSAWTAEDDAFLSGAYQSQGAAVCAQLLGRSIDAIYLRARVLGVAKTTAGRGKLQGAAGMWTEADDAYLRAHWGSASGVEIAEHLRRTYRSVASRAKLLGLGKQPQ